ncbi:hypothetical protein T265_01699 [Opisthorchis viverrini]|uniref:Palmitoyltransferase n=1 Tax=Opisthorchis viverrini TaxID=6198 RepID=A0A075AIV1_OPIVI|nr:hypothetical protein T265_01699 [Opisthorchis viverrini]KER32274.1 hypothetical protein T265_01699 [Opisthorchis viverrini]
MSGEKGHLCRPESLLDRETEWFYLPLSILTNWGQSIVAPTLKKGIHSECGNHRGISLTPFLNKSSALLTLHRLLMIREEFRLGRGCVDHTPSDLLSRLNSNHGLSYQCDVVLALLRLPMGYLPNSWHFTSSGGTGQPRLASRSSDHPFTITEFAQQTGSLATVRKVPSLFPDNTHCLYQIIYILVVLSGHCILFSQVIPVLYRYSDRENHLFLVLALLFCNGFCYTMVCMMDPGVISPRNLPVYSQIYAFDHVIYSPKECMTCPHIIPARARHCSVAPFRCLTAIPPEGDTGAGILPGYPSLDRGSRGAEVGFEPRTFRSVNSPSNYLSHLAPSSLPDRHRSPLWGEMAQWLERESTDRKVRDSNPTSAFRFPLSRLGQPGHIPALVLPSGGMAARHQKGAELARCDHCVFRFEHHCVWTNCCIGGENYSHFLLFIASSLAMVVNALRLEIRMLCDYTEQQRLWSAQYLGEDGEVHEMSWPALIQCITSIFRFVIRNNLPTSLLLQHLFMSFPLVVAMVTVLCIIGLFLGGYTAFHAWLVCTNQTSYEYSRNRRRSTQLTTTKTNRKIFGDGGHFINPSHSAHPYDRGTWSNLSEIFGFSVRNSLRELRRRLPVQMDFKTR